ncbi:MAG: alpha-hydroxy acid oxidase [Thermoflexales bacterium]
MLAAPSAFQRLAHPDGELATARATATLGTIMTLSTYATTSLEDVAKAYGAPKVGGRWFQLYAQKDRGITRRLVERAQAAGYTAIVLTVDLPMAGKRESDQRTPLRFPEGMRMANRAFCAATTQHAPSITVRAASSFPTMADASWTTPLPESPPCPGLPQRWPGAHQC